MSKHEIMRYIRVQSTHVEVNNPRDMYIVTKHGFNACLKIRRPPILEPTDIENQHLSLEETLGTSPRYRLFEICQNAGITTLGYDWCGDYVRLFTADNETFMTLCLIFDNHVEIPIKYNGEEFDRNGGIYGDIDNVIQHAEEIAKKTWSDFESRKCVSS